MFFMSGNNLKVKHGKGSNQLSIGDTFLVGIRYGHMKQVA
jgi:hypothetical protein